MSYIKNPSSIEEMSFRIIQSVIEEQHPDYQFQNDMEECIIKRAIHTTGDFDFLYNMRFTHNVIAAITKVLKGKGTLILDSTISLNGINKRVLDQMGVSYICLISNEQVCQLARDKQITRAMAAIDYAKTTPGPKLFAFGGAPTALSYLIELIEKKEIQAEAVLGLPVGFINVEESKTSLINSSIPAIATVGRKGGSTIVVSTINAIIYQLKEVITDDYVRYSRQSTQQEGEK